MGLAEASITEYPYSIINNPKKQRIGLAQTTSSSGTVPISEIPLSLYLKTNDKDRKEFHSFFLRSFFGIGKNTHDDSRSRRVFHNRFSIFI